MGFCNNKPLQDNVKVTIIILQTCAGSILIAINPYKSLPIYGSVSYLFEGLASCHNKNTGSFYRMSSSCIIPITSDPQQSRKNLTSTIWPNLRSMIFSTTYRISLLLLVEKAVLERLKLPNSCSIISVRWAPTSAPGCSIKSLRLTLFSKLSVRLQFIQQYFNLFFIQILKINYRQCKNSPQR